MFLFSRIHTENENRSMETVDTSALQNEVEKVIVRSIFAELFDFWLRILKPYVAHFLWMGYSYIRLIQLIWSDLYQKVPQVPAGANIISFKL